MTARAAAASLEDEAQAAQGGVHRPGVGLAVGTLLLFAGLAVLHTWPLAAAPGTWSRHDNADAMLNEWAVAWVAHQLPRDPLRLFDANIFHPERNTLAFSEHLFVQSLLGAPLLWAGLPTVTVHNLLVVGGLTLTGWAMWFVMYRWTGDGWASLVAGLLLAFNAHTLTRVAHLQAMHAQFLPFAVYFLHRLLAHPRPACAVALGLAVTLQALTSNYLLAFMAFAMVAAALTRPGEWLGRGRLRTFGLLTLAALLATILLLPFLLPYAGAHRDQGLTRTLQTVSIYGGSWRDYVATGAWLHHDAWSARFWAGSRAALFPGVAALVLAGAAVVSGLAWRDRRARLWMGVGAIGFVLSFGTSLPGYDVLHRYVPLLQGIRAPVRFGYLVLVAVAALAGFGLAGWRRRWGAGSRAGPALGLAAALLVTLEAARFPMGYVPAYVVPSVYRALLTEAPGAVVELPLPPPAAFDRNAPYMLNSTVHWRPLVNGYSGFLPASYHDRRVDLAMFPDADTLAVLRRLGVRYVALHRAEFSTRRENALGLVDGSPGLRLIAQHGDVSIHRVLDDGETP
jgi:hypothetical protein